MMDVDILRIFRPMSSAKKVPAVAPELSRLQVTTRSSEQESVLHLMVREAVATPTCGSSIKQLLREYTYPPERHDQAVAMVLKQAKALADSWTR